MANEHMHPILQLGGPMPTSLGRCADLLHDVRELRLAMQKEVEALEARESEIKNHLINNVVKGDTGWSGLKYRVQIIPEKKPILTPDGWGGFTSWMNKHSRFDMIQKRLSEKPIMEFKDSDGGKLPPGLEIMNVPKVSLTKI